MYGPRLTGSRVILAPPLHEHVDDYQRWFSNPLVTRFLSLRNPRSREQYQEFLRAHATDPNSVLWAILVDDRHIGNTSIDSIDWRNRHGDTGIVIGEPDCWGHGYATEVMRLRTAYAFNELGLQKLTTNVYGPNESSRRALQRAGYREVGWLRRHVYLEGAFYDVWLGEVLREEWPPTDNWQPTTDN